MKKRPESKQGGRRKGKTFVDKFSVGQGKGTHRIVRTKQSKGG